MYKVREKVYADAGKILIGTNRIGYAFIGQLSDFVEEDVVIEDMSIEGKFLVYSNGMIREVYDGNATYEQLKSKYVKWLFTNDDQIAIMLNRGASEEDDALFDKMQEWRAWSGRLAKKVLSLKGQM